MAFEQWMPVSRRGGGEFYSNNFNVPSGIDAVTLLLDIPNNEFATDDLSLSMVLELSTDSGNTWKTQLGVVWYGGTVPVTVGGIIIGWRAYINGFSTLSGQLVRVHFITVGTFRWGLLGEIS